MFEEYLERKASDQQRLNMHVFPKCPCNLFTTYLLRYIVFCYSRIKLAGDKAAHISWSFPRSQPSTMKLMALMC